MFKHFFKKSNDDDIFETVDPIVEQRRNEKFSKPLIYDEEFKKEEVTKKSEGQQIPKETTSKNVKKVEKKVAKKEEPEVKKNYEMMDIISPMFGMHEEKEETDSEAVLTAVEDSKDFQDETNTDAEKTIEPEIVEEEKLPTVEDNLRNIAKIVEEEQDQLKIIEERTGEFKLDFGQKKSEEQNSLIDEIDDNMSLDELMSLYEKKFKD